LPENRASTIAAIQHHGADVRHCVGWRFDRCFLFDETGRFIEGYYIVGLLAAGVFTAYPGEKIIHDPRLTWNTVI